MKKYFALTIIAASISLAACSDDDDDPVTPSPDMTEMPVTPPAVVPDATPGEGATALDTIFGSEDHKTLLAAIESIDGLAATLDNPDSQFTVFAPTDAAFQALADADPDDAITAPADLLTDENEALLTRVLQGHVIAQLVASGEVAELATSGQTTDTLAAGAPLTFAATSTDPAATSGFDVVGAPDGDVPATPIALNSIDLGSDLSQGVVHSLDTVITVPAAPEVVEPPMTEPNPNTGEPSDLPAAVQAGGANGVVGQAFAASFSGQFTGADVAAPGAPTESETWTFFVPTDAALPTGNISDIALAAYVHTGGALTAALLADGGTVTMADNSTPAVTNDGTVITVGGAIATEIGTTPQGGIIYSLDTVFN